MSLNRTRESSDGRRERFIQKWEMLIFGIANVKRFLVRVAQLASRETDTSIRKAVDFGRPFAENQPYLVEEKHVANDSR